jgi:hypothetical protein
MMEKNKAKSSSYGMFTSICWVVGLGIILGVLLGIPFKAGGEWERSQLAALLATGIALAYIILSLVDWVVQWRALSANPLPYELELSDRTIAKEQVKALKGNAPLQRHIRRLLAAWGSGASGPQVAAMEGNQMFRTMTILAAETAAILILLAGSANFAPPPALLTLGTGFMVLVVLGSIARFQLASQLAGYIESHLLARIGNDTPAAAGVGFAEAVAKSVSSSTESLAASQTEFAAQLAKAQEAAAAQITQSQEAAAAQFVKSQKEAAEVISKAQSETAAKLAAAQEAAAGQLSKSQAEVAAQLGRVTEVASSIDTILKLQQTVDGTLKGVTATAEFKDTLVELKRHLSESDELLKNAAKPRTIRLVEKDND